MKRSTAVATALALVAMIAGETALSRAAEAQAALSITPASQEFGSVPSGAASGAIVFTILNRGNAPTKGLSVGLAGNGASSFSIASSTCGALLASGATCAVGVKFIPRSVGSRTASLDIKATPGGTIRANLSGTGTAGGLNCAGGQAMQNGMCVNLPAGATTTSCPSGVANGTGGCTGAALGTSPSSRDFGSVRSGATSAALAFTVSNSSTGSVNGLSVVVSGLNASSFSIAANTCGATLAPGASCTVSVKFSPSSIGTKSGSLDVAATPGGTTRSSLSGTAIP